MKWTMRLGAAAVMLGISASAPAGLLGGLFSSHGGDDCCPQRKRPTVARPCEKTYTYQREVSNLRPPVCDGKCAPGGECAPGGDCVKGGKACEVPCDAGCAPPDCRPKWKHRKSNLLDRLCDMFERDRRVCGHGPSCTDPTCAAECGPPLECGDPCEVAELIYEARTACYGKDRARAVHKLGKFDCRCHPEVMATLVYSLNDTHERVRNQAADEIGDLIEDGRCCCSPEVVAALTCTLGDCDRKVRRQAEEALELCGYEIVEGGCPAGCDGTSCQTAPAGKAHVGGGGKAVPPQTPPAPNQAAPAPAPPQEAAPAPMKKKAGKKAESAPVPKKDQKPKKVKKKKAEKAPAPPKAPKAGPAPAPPEDAEAYFPSRYRR